MPNVSMKKLTRANAKEKNPLAKLRLLACLLRKKGHSIRRIVTVRLILFVKPSTFPLSVGD